MFLLKNILLAIAFTTLFSCVNPSTRNNIAPVVPELPVTGGMQPDYNYFIQPLAGWTMFDSTLQGLKTRLLFSPADEGYDFPRGNIFIGAISIKNADSLLQSNIDAMKIKQPSSTIMDQGKMKIRDFDVRWFTYSLEQNGRDLINYIIPAGEFAYFITFGSNSGSLGKYRAGFDKMVTSFRLPSRGQTREFEPKDINGSSAYLPTGIYFVTYEGQGIKRKIHQSSEEAWIEPKAFASADHIIQADLQHDQMDGATFASLNIQFDEKGAEDLAAGTGIHSQPKIAIVVANKLVYVVDNTSKISKGSLHIVLDGFSMEELEGMRSAAANRK